MKIYETVPEMDLSDIDLSNVSENISNADKIFETIVNKIGEYLADTGINLVLSLILLIVGWKLINLLSKKMKEGKIFGKIEPTARSFMRSALTIVLKILLVITIAAMLGVPMTSMVAVVTSCGLAIGLALQGSLSNFAGGVLILVLKPFRVGDYIVDGGTGLEGTVEDIDIFYTKLATPDNKSVCIPNGSLSNSGITNVSAKGKRRLDFTVGIGYTSDIKLAKKLITDVISKREKVLKDEDVTVFVGNLGESSVDIGFRCWVNGADYWTEKWEILEEVKLTFDANGIEIPFNQIDVHMKNS